MRHNIIIIYIIRDIYNIYTLYLSTGQRLQKPTTIPSHDKIILDTYATMTIPKYTLNDLGLASHDCDLAPYP